MSLSAFITFLKLTELETIPRFNRLGLSLTLGDCDSSSTILQSRMLQIFIMSFF